MQASAFDRNTQRLGGIRLFFKDRLRSGLRPLRPAPAPSAHPLREVGHPVLTSVRTGRDWSPVTLRPIRSSPPGCETPCPCQGYGQGGIRTLGWFYPTHAFQASPIDRSGTCPAIAKHKPNWPLLRVDSPKVVLRLPSDKLEVCQPLFRYPSA